MNPYREIERWHRELSAALRRRHDAPHHRRWVRHCIRKIRLWERQATYSPAIAAVARTL